ncbi:MAG: glycosyltransferase family 4 protein [Gammaproteobacteria bacterium]
MKKVLIIIDKPGWSYDTIAQGLMRYNDNENTRFEIASVEEELEVIERNHCRYDLVFALGWTLVIAKKRKHRFRDELAFLDRTKLVTGIHSHRSWDGYESLPHYSPPPPADLVSKLSRLSGVNAISRRLFHVFREAGLTNVVLTENGVDTELFEPARPVGVDRRSPLKVGFSGSKDIAKHDYLKGFSDFIAPLQGIPNVEVKVLGGRGGHQVEREGMPDLYNQIDVYLCASTSEGFSQSVLEAAACGRAVVSTRVGGCEDLIEEGHNGHFVGRDLQEIAGVMTRLESQREEVRRLGENNRAKVLREYAWRVRVHDWLAFIESRLATA